MTCVFEAQELTKRFNGNTVLDSVDLRIEGPAIVGLLGRNGCGKTTLIRHITGQYLPTGGAATTLGTPGAELGHDELANVGYVSQDVRLLNWMTVEQHLEYVASFYPSWDTGRQSRLLEILELEPHDMVGNLSPGNLQKLAIILAVCHHPALLILDEPVSDLDPISRAQLLQFLLELLREDGTTILVSSHVLRDVEKVVDWVICLDGGRITTDAALDELKESLQTWIVQSPDDDLPERFFEPFILGQEIDGRQAKLVVRGGTNNLDAFRVKYGIVVTPRPMNLEDMFPWLLRGEPQ